MFHRTQGYWLLMSRGFPLRIRTGTGRYQLVHRIVSTIDQGKFRYDWE